MLESPTRLKGRMGRVSYALNSACYMVAGRILLSVPADGTFERVLLTMVLVMIAASQVAFATRRLHDIGIGMSGVTWTMLPLLEGVVIWETLVDRTGGPLSVRVVTSVLVAWGVIGWVYLLARRPDPKANRHGQPVAKRQKLSKGQAIPGGVQRIRLGSETME